jgi:hypothetical protein
MHPYRLDGERVRERERLLSRERDLVCRDVLRGRERDREGTRRTTRVVLRSGEPRPRDRRTEPLLDRLKSNPQVSTSVADPDPGSGAFFDPWIRNS